MIHLVWSGKGYVVPLVAFASSLLTEVLVETLFNDEKYYQEHGWPIFTALAVAGLIVREVAPRIFRERKLRDETTGEIVVLKEDHTFFFIHIKHWGIILLICAVIAFYAVERNENGGKRSKPSAALTAKQCQESRFFIACAIVHPRSA